MNWKIYFLIFIALALLAGAIYFYSISKPSEITLNQTDCYWATVDGKNVQFCKIGQVKVEGGEIVKYEP